MAFGFGLIHGFGFASVLTDLLLPERALALALAGFNLGVEAGQITIVAAFLPAAYLMRKTWLYRGFVFVGGSSAIVIIASLWLLERSLNFNSSLFTNHMCSCAMGTRHCAGVNSVCLSLFKPFRHRAALAV